MMTTNNDGVDQESIAVFLKGKRAKTILLFVFKTHNTYPEPFQRKNL